METQSPALQEIIERLNEKQAQANIDAIYLFARNADNRKGQKASEQLLELNTRIEQINADFQPMRNEVALMAIREKREAKK